MSARPLQPAYAGAGDAAPESSSASPAPTSRQSNEKKSRRVLIESACQACRRRKSRCNGIRCAQRSLHKSIQNTYLADHQSRPTCSRCANLRTDCHYEAEEGESRWSALRRKNHLLEAERNDLRDILTSLQGSSEPEAIDLLHRIRTTPVDVLPALLRQIRGETAAGIPQQQMPSHPMRLAENRLPPIQAILDVSSRAPPPPPPPHLSSSTSLSSEDSKASLPRATLPGMLEPAKSTPTLRSLPSLSSEDSTASSKSAPPDHRPYLTPP